MAVVAHIETPIERKKDTLRMIRSFNEENWATFINLLQLESWDEIYNDSDLDTKSDIFMKLLIQYFETSFPLKKSRRKANQKNKVKLPGSTRLLKIQLRNMNDEIKYEEDPIRRVKMRKERVTLKKAVRASINKEVKAVNDRKINRATNKSRAAWQIIKESTGKTRPLQELTSLKINGSEEFIKLKIANFLNTSFLVPVPEEKNAAEYNFEAPENLSDFSLQPTSEAEVYTVIRNLKSKRSFGWDGISVEVLKRIAMFVSKPLSYMINLSFTEGKFPKNMKLAKIIPIFKKGDKNEAANYRPIAITSSFSKVYEKIFLSRLEGHLQMNNCLIPEQHGFKKGKSTVTALFDFVTESYSSLEAREKLNVILYDFSNAFGTLHPLLLMKKLKIYGLSDKALSWMQSFLLQREQYVQLADTDPENMEVYINSERRTSDMGVPQGTILGPTSFTTYLNDISLVIIIALLLLFADDSSALVKGKTNEEVNNKTVTVNNQFVNFAEENHLKINGSKTKILQLHTHQTRNVVPPQISIYDTNVETVKSSKLLGVVISDTMNWAEQCKKVANKLRSVTYLFTMLQERVTENVLKQVYYAYAQSQILYSVVIWGGSSHMNEVFIGQKRVIRAMAGKRYWRSNCALDSCRPLFKRFGILTVYSLYILECLKYLKKYPEKFTKLNETPTTHRHITRHISKTMCKNDLLVPECTLLISTENPSVMIPRLFNSLPVDIKLIEDSKEFLRRVKELVLHYQFYDLNEYYVCDFVM